MAPSKLVTMVILTLVGSLLIYAFVKYSYTKSLDAYKKFLNRSDIFRMDETVNIVLLLTSSINSIKNILKKRADFRDEIILIIVAFVIAIAVIIFYKRVYMGAIALSNITSSISSP